MSIKDKLISAYDKIARKNNISKTNNEKDDGIPSYYFGLLEDNDYAESNIDDNQEILINLDQETRNYLIHNKEKLANIALPPKYIPVHFVTDTPTATQVFTLLGMIRWAMEQSATDMKEYSIKIRIKNRNSSPFLLGMGDVALPKVAVQDEFEIGD